MIVQYRSEFTPIKCRNRGQTIRISPSHFMELCRMYMSKGVEIHDCDYIFGGASVIQDLFYIPGIVQIPYSIAIEVSKEIMESLR